MIFEGVPKPEHILQIISAEGFKASFKSDEDGVEDCVPLTAWVFLKDGNSIPLIYDLEGKKQVNAYAVQGFLQITHEDFLEDEEPEGFL